MISRLKNVLRDVRHQVRDEKMDLISAAGQLPPTECWPELWVMEDEKGWKRQGDSQEDPGANNHPSRRLGCAKTAMK
jgi:hypothetical protein